MAMIWTQNEQSGFNRTGSAPAYLSPSQAVRAERIRQARLLYDGKHRAYYLDEARTQFNFPQMRAGDRIIRPYLTYNLLGLISNKSADLLVGQAPVMLAESDRQQAALDDLVERSGMHAVLIGLGVNASAEGEAFLEAVEYDGEAHLREVDGQYIYPAGQLRPDGQYDAYQRFETEAKMLLVSTYRRGSIDRELWKLGDSGEKVSRLDVNLWPHRTLVWGDTVKTGMKANLITWIPNLMLRGKPVSDYDGGLDLQDKVNAANTQIARVLAKHADPRMAFPASAFDKDGNIRSDNDAIAVSESGEAPSYITWSGELEAAMKDRAFAVNALLIKSEMSPVLLGLKEGAAPDAYKKVRLEAFNALSKAQRKSLYFAHGLRLALVAAQQLENTLGGNSGYPIGPISVQLRDGIPIDEKEQADTISTLRSANAISRARMVAMLIADPAGQKQEMSELEAESFNQTVEAWEKAKATAEPAVPQADTSKMPVPQGDQQVEVSEAAVLNGAQITAATAIVTAVAAGEMPRDAGLGQLEVLFNLTTEQANKIMGKAGTSVPTTPNPRPNVTGGDAAGLNAGVSGEEIFNG